MEKLLTNTSYSSKDKAKFSCVRFGNVAWSEASVLHLWQKQAESGSHITLTDKEATRFFMSIDQAVKLVLRAAELTQGGEIFILKMPSVKMADLANIFINKYFSPGKIKVKLIEKRLGDKTHEELFDLNDTQKLVLENKEMFIIVPREKTYLYSIQPKLSAYKGFRPVARTTYASQNNLKNEEIRKIV